MNPWHIFLPKRSVVIVRLNFTRNKTGRFGMFIVLPIHKESLRKMMQRGLIDYDVKIIVLRVLKQKICDEFGRSHGDIKEILIHYRKSEDNLIVIQLNLQNQEIAR